MPLALQESDQLAVLQVGAQLDLVGRDGVPADCRDRLPRQLDVEVRDADPARQALRPASASAPMKVSSGTPLPGAGQWISVRSTWSVRSFARLSRRLGTSLSGA